MTENMGSEELVNKLVLQEQTEEALALLFQMISEALKEKEFSRAERLRDRIYDIDSMALDVIIKTNDLIDNAKEGGIDKVHREIWKEFYEALSPEESSAFYYALKEVSFDMGHRILSQGDVSRSLFLIDGGGIKVSYTVKDKEIFLDSLKSGALFGSESFFYDSVSTFSFVAESDVTLHQLDKDALTAWDATLPMLKNKLSAFCERGKSLKDMLAQRGQDRRVSERVAASGLVKFQILSGEGRSPRGDFKGKLLDISKGGLAFLIKTNRDTAHLLLGRSLKLDFIFRSGGVDHPFKEVGRVTAVQFLPLFSDSGNDYSIHLKCDLHVKGDDLT